MSSSVGSVNFDIIKGLPEPLRQRVEKWEVPGQDGYGAQTLGLGDAEFELRAIVYIDTNTDANALINSAVDLQGTVVTIVDDWGDTYTPVLVLHVGPPIKMPCIYKGTTQVRVEITFHCVSTI